MICFNCGKTMDDKPLRVEPNRHLRSPLAANFNVKKESDKWYEYYCDEKCKNETFKARYKFFAELDRNASDSECFEHDHWETNLSGRKLRVGKCKITGDTVVVEPLQPGDNSGQPRKCYEHFTLRGTYV